MTGNTTGAFEDTATDWVSGKISIISAPAAAWGFVIAIDGVCQQFPNVEVAKCFLAARRETMAPDDFARLADEFEAAAQEVEQLNPDPTRPEVEMWREVIARSIEKIRANNSRH
jgi:hypothetical protein